MVESNVYIVTAAVLSLIVLVLGLALAWLAWSRSRAGAAEAAALERTRAEAGAELATLRERLRGIEAERGQQAAELERLRLQAQAWRDQVDALSNDKAQLGERALRVPLLEAQVAQAQPLQAQVAELSARLEAERQAAGQLLVAERQQAQEKLTLLHEAREQLSNQFKALANDILEEKSKRFAEQNQASLGTLLDPLRMRLGEFQQKVETFYHNEGKERSQLSEQVSQLMAMNQTLGEEARNLTQALKGSAKLQGNWGEMILERVLESSGLRRGHEYEVQQTFQRDGEALRPDVVLYLPGERRLVIDAKVSLLAYEQSVRCDSDEERQAAYRRHLQSLRAHITDLSSKRYEQLPGGQGLDFVLLFVPIEPAFHAALSADDKLYVDAMEKNVLLVSPLTLLSVVRLIAQLWRQEKQRLNAKEIAERGAKLYDKLHSFVAELERLGGAIGNAQLAYERAFKLLRSGSGSAIRQAEMLRELGVRTDKRFSDAALEGADIGAEPPPLQLAAGGDVSAGSGGGSGGATVVALPRPGAPLAGV